MKKLKKRCKFCNLKDEFKPSGFSENLRYECPNCHAIFIPLKTRLFGKYKNYPSWVERKNWAVNFNISKSQKIKIKA